MLNSSSRLKTKFIRGGREARDPETQPESGPNGGAALGAGATPQPGQRLQLPVPAGAAGAGGQTKVFRRAADRAGVARGCRAGSPDTEEEEVEEQEQGCGAPGAHAHRQDAGERRDESDGDDEDAGRWCATDAVPAERQRLSLAVKK